MKMKIFISQKHEITYFKVKPFFNSTSNGKFTRPKAFLFCRWDSLRINRC